MFFNKALYKKNFQICYILNYSMSNCIKFFSSKKELKKGIKNLREMSGNL